MFKKTTCGNSVRESLSIILNRSKIIDLSRIFDTMLEVSAESADWFLANPSQWGKPPSVFTSQL